MIKLNSQDVSKLYLGGSPVAAAWQGSVKIYPATGPTGGLPPGRNTYYQSVLNVATLNGYTLPSSLQQDLQNDLVQELIDQGIWDKLDVFYVFANDGSKEFGNLNWKDPGAYECTTSGSPLWTADQGYTGVPVSSTYVDTGFNVGGTAQFSNGDASLFAYVYNDIANNTYGDIGLIEQAPYTGTQWGAINSRLPAVGALNSRAEYNLLDTTTSPFWTSDVPTSVGFSHVDRANSSQIKFYKNGTLLNTRSATETTLPATLTLQFLKGRLLADYSARTVSIGGVGSSLSTEASAFYTAINTYMTSI